MSAIFGLIHLDGSPVAADDLVRMQQALAYWGEDGGGLWQQGHVGLGCNIRQITPESRYETFPVTGAGNTLWLTGSARLDNREDLCRVLGIPQVDWPTTPDTLLLLLAYERWGGDCPEYILGDWSLALWDQRQQQLFLARDHFGNTAFYYYHNSRFLAFASGKKGLLALPQVPKNINQLRIAQILTSWPGDGVQTAYDGIFRLPPAHTLTITGPEIVKRRYWRAEETPELHLPRAEDYQERFLELYQAAVNSCLRSLRPVGATLSGGLDSGSVCTLAARELAKEGRRLPVFSSIPLVPTEGLIKQSYFGDESPYIEATARWAGNIDVTYITAADITPLEGIQNNLTLHDEPGHSAANSYWITALLRRAQQRGLGVILTGQLGNATVSWTGGPVSLWTLLGAGHWQALRREIQMVSGSKLGQDLWYLLRNQILRPIVVRGRFLSNLWQQRGQEPWESYSAINKNWARSLNLTSKMRFEGHDPWFTPSSNFQQQRFKILRPDRAIVGHLLAELDAGYSLAIRDPTLDKRLLEFCLAVPNHCYNRGGQSRLLLRNSMAGLMPPRVLWNSRKGLQAADLGPRVLNSASEIIEILNQLERSPLGREYLDLVKMQRVLDSLKVRVTPENTNQCASILLRGLMAGIFLLRFEK